MNTILQIKHYFFATLIVIISLSCVYGQQEEKTTCKSKKEIFAFGPKISVNSSNEWMSTTFKSSFLTGADLGLFFRFSPGRFYVQPEIYYAIRNQGVKFEWHFNTNSMRYQTHHIGLPVLLGVKAIDFKFFKFRFFVGPEFSLKLKGDNHEQMNYQLGFQAGLGLDLWRFTIDAGYTLLGYIHPNRNTHCNIVKVGVGFKCF